MLTFFISLSGPLAFWLIELPIPFVVPDEESFGHASALLNESRLALLLLRWEADAAWLLEVRDCFK